MNPGRPCALQTSPEQVVSYYQVLDAHPREYLGQGSGPVTGRQPLIDRVEQPSIANRPDARELPACPVATEQRLEHVIHWPAPGVFTELGTRNLKHSLITRMAIEPACGIAPVLRHALKVA